MISLPWTMARLRRIALNVVAIGLASLSVGASSQELKIVLSGSHEIPPVMTTASGTASITVNADKSVTGNATIAGMAVTVAHIHEGAAGTNGPIIILPLVKTADNVWSVPPGARLSDAQYESSHSGQCKLDFNIHSGRRTAAVKSAVRSSPVICAKAGYAWRHSMTLSARSSSSRGISMPSVRAVLRLMTNSSTVGCSIGRLPGVAPFIFGRRTSRWPAVVQGQVLAVAHETAGFRHFPAGGDLVGKRVSVASLTHPSLLHVEEGVGRHDRGLCAGAGDGGKSGIDLVRVARLDRRDSDSAREASPCPGSARG